MSRYHEQVAAECIRRLRRARDKRAEMFQLIDDLNTLTRDDRGRYLTRDDRLEIVDLVLERIGRRRHENEYEFPDILSGDNIRYLDLVSALKGLIK